MAKFFIDRPKFALVIAIIMVLGGIIGLNAIPVAEFPEITPPVVQVTASYPGASADVVEESVAAPIEAQVNGVDDMLYMSSTSTNSGDYTLNVTFAVGTDPDIAAVNVQNRVAIATSQLPQEVVAQGVVTRKQSTSMLLIIHLTSPDGSRDALFLSNYASIYLQDNLARLPGVGSVSQFGALDYGMRVWLDPDRLTALSLTTTDIANAIQRQNLQASAGQLGAPPFQGQTPTFQFTLQAKGRLTTVEEFGAIVVRANTDGSFVRLRDVARIELGSQAYSSISKLNGTPAAAIAVYQSPGANALGVAEALYAELERLEVRFPPGVEYQILYDTTDAVRASVQEVLITLLMTFALVVAVTFLFLADWRSTLIPTLAIPVSLIGTFAVLYAVGYSMNMITLFALILAIGIVVDDAIIVVENVQRIMAEKGLAPREATYQAMAEVTGPVIATTLVLLAVFVPVSFMPGITGELYRQFSVTIAVAVSLSSINALTLAPALCRLLLKPESSKPKGLLLLFSGVVDLTRNAYVALVGVLVRASTLAVVFIALVGAGVMYLFSATPSGFLPIEDRKALFVNIQLPDGAALGRTEAVVDDVSERLRQIEGVSDIIEITGYSILSGAASNAALMIPILTPWEERQTLELRWFSILRQINAELATLAGATAFAFPPPPISGLGTGGGIEAQLQDFQGESPQALAAATRSLAFGANQHPALTDVFSTYSANVPQYFLDVDRDKAQVLGVSVADIFTTLQANLGSLYINDFNLYGKVYRVIIQAEAPFRNDIEDIGRLYVRSASGDMVPLQGLIDIQPVLGPLAITRYNQFASAAIQGSPTTGYSTGDAIAALEAVAVEALPEGYAIEWTGTSKQELEAGGYVVFIFALAIVFAYLFLVAQYESWSIPLAVMLSVLVAMFGALVPLYFLPFLDNNLYAQIGIVLLIGLASKTAILMVEFAMVERAAGKSIREAAMGAARLRYRAVMMTALSFLLGVLPLVFASGAGAASRQVVGFVVVGGMGAATVVGIFLIPPLYAVVQGLREQIKAPAKPRRRKKKRVGTRGAAIPQGR